MDDFCLYFLWFFSVFRRTVGQSEIFLSLKPSAFQGESPLKIWAHQGSRRLGGVRGQTHSILIALEDILQRHIFQKLKPTTDYLHFFNVVYSFQIFYIRNKKLSYKSISFQIILLFLAFNIIMKEKLSLKYTFILLIIS